MSAFKKVPRVFTAEDGVAPISPEMAKYAAPADAPLTGVAKAQAEAEARAKKLEGTEEQVHEILGSKDVAARYKIQVFFGPKRTLLGPNVVQVQFFESGKKLHGGGDELLAICRNIQNESEGCGGFIPGDCVKGMVAMCPNCHQAIARPLCTEQLIANFSTRRLAKELVKFWYQLGSNADVYCKYDKDDIHYTAMVQKLGAKRARELRGRHIYPLKNILTDTAAGADLESRFFAFLTA